MEVSLKTVLEMAFIFIPGMYFFLETGDHKIAEYGNEYTRGYGKLWRYIHGTIDMSIILICSIVFLIKEMQIVNIDTVNINIRWAVGIVMLILIFAFIIDEFNISRMSSQH